MRNRNAPGTQGHTSLMERLFAVGDAARVRLGNPRGHCRVPGYLRGKCGRILALAGAFPLADERARGQYSEPEPLYTVRFAANDVWGADGDARLSITAELWESYLEGPQ